MLRVVGGIYKRRKLEQPPLNITRATKDIAKEGLFNSLGDIKNKTFLDCFSGSGAIAIEAYSRGAKVTLIENNLEAIKIIKNNLNSLKITEICTLFDDFYKVINKINNSFNYVFIDPPYIYNIDLEFINNLYKLNIINLDSVMIIERDKELDKELLDKFNFKLLKYSKTLMYILRSK